MKNTSSFTCMSLKDVRLKAPIEVLPHHGFTSMSVYIYILYQANKSDSEPHLENWN